MKAIEAAARAKYEQGDEYYGTWDDLDPVLQEYAISLTTIEIRAYLAALAEDDAAVERIKAAIWETYRASDAMDSDLMGLSYAELIGLPENPSVLFVKKLLADEARAAIRAMGGE